jgi:hypothetical protein
LATVFDEAVVMDAAGTGGDGAVGGETTVELIELRPSDFPNSVIELERAVDVDGVVAAGDKITGCGPTENERAASLTAVLALDVDGVDSASAKGCVLSA